MRWLLSLTVCGIGVALFGLGAHAIDSSGPPAESPQVPAIAEPQETVTGGDSPAGEAAVTEPGAPPTDEIQERGLPLKGLPDRKVPAPSGMASPSGFVGATDNITRVGRAIQVRAKSLTMLVTVAAGVSVTQPVTISIALGGYGPTRQTQSYVPSTGNRFLYNDPEGDGKPRRAFADITLTEPKPGGGVYTSTMPGNVMLDPLYDITISPLSVKLIDDCDAYGDSDMYVDWYAPDDQYHHFYFKTRARNSATTINAFAWARAEVSALANLHIPTYFVTELDPGESIDPNYKGPGHPNVNLVPGNTNTFVAKVNVLTRHKQCRANIQYTITYKLRWYPYL